MVQSFAVPSPFQFYFLCSKQSNSNSVIHLVRCPDFAVIKTVVQLAMSPPSWFAVLP